MVKKSLVVGMLAVSLIMLNGKETLAKTCVAYYRGTCVAWSGSVGCKTGSTGVGNVSEEDTYQGCIVTTGDVIGHESELPAIDPPPPWVIGCGTPGNDMMAPGANTISIDGFFGGFTQLTPEMVTQNGKAESTSIAYPGSNLLAELTDIARTGNYCPGGQGDNWSVVDAVPCEMNLRHVLMKKIEGEFKIVGEAGFYCTLPDCETLEVDSVTKRFEERQYDCDLRYSVDYGKDGIAVTY